MSLVYNSGFLQVPGNFHPKRANCLLLLIHLGKKTEVSPSHPPTTEKWEGGYSCAWSSGVDMHLVLIMRGLIPNS